MKGRVLIIAGSDPSGGAGVQADIKTVTALGGYAASAITALTVQNTLGVTATHPAPPALIGAQMDAVLSDIGADAVKIGMLGDADAAALIAEKLSVANAGPIVLDPVLVATSGDCLAGAGVKEIILHKLAPLAALITPNLDEAEALTGVAARNEDEMADAGAKLVAMGAGAALIKGGHGVGETVKDVLVTSAGIRIFSNPRLDTRSTHGTGCTLSSAVATGLAQGLALSAAVKRAIDYTHQAIKTAPGFGGGAGPVNHGHTVRKAP